MSELRCRPRRRLEARLAGKTVIEVVKMVFPRISDDVASYILWERTAFPFSDLRTTWKQLHQFKRANASGRPLCTWCNSIVAKEGNDCGRCTKAFLPHVEASS